VRSYADTTRNSVAGIRYPAALATAFPEGTVEVTQIVVWLMGNIDLLAGRNEEQVPPCR
jgi:hypothetical protein